MARVLEGLPSTRSASAPAAWASTTSGTASCPRRPTATTRSAVASSTPSPSRWRSHRSPTSCGWRPRPPISHDAKKFADAIHAVFPDKMLAYNLSPSFSWDTTGMTDEQMKRFPEELGKLGFVFNFITYGGHQIDGLAAEEFAAPPAQDGMLALARCSASSGCSSRRTARRRPWSAARARRRPDGRPRAAPRRPRRWARGRRSSSTCADRGAAEAARGVARALGHEARDRRKAAGLPEAAPRRLAAAGAGGADAHRRQSRERRLRHDPGPARAQHPVDPRPEHVRSEPAPQAPDDADAAVSRASLQASSRCTTSRRPRTTTGRPRA
jgi:hypothetical protein